MGLHGVWLRWYTAHRALFGHRVPSSLSAHTPPAFLTRPNQPTLTRSHACKPSLPHPPQPTHALNFNLDPTPPPLPSPSPSPSTTPFERDVPAVPKVFRPRTRFYAPEQPTRLSAPNRPACLFAPKQRMGFCAPCACKHLPRLPGAEAGPHAEEGTAVSLAFFIFLSVLSF